MPCWRRCPSEFPRALPRLAWVALLVPSPWPRVPASAPAASMASGYTESTSVFIEHGVGRVTVEGAEEPPEPSPGGKYRDIIPRR